MKLQSNNLLENLTNEEIKSLTLQVSETVAKDCKKEKKRIFSAADFWDIQRRKRNLLTKRFAF
jgi:hypothetical protein